MNNKIYLFVLLLSFLYPQWAMWANPSLPVGNSDRGVGLGAGEIMLFADFSYQYFDWWHDVVPGAYMPNTNTEEGFEHEGLFVNKSLNFGATIGLNDYWNMTYSQIFSERCMDWEGPVDNNGNSLTVHHRTECSTADFIDNDRNKTIAFGGKLGDAKINFRYLLANQGKGPGNRVFLGFGFTIPSNYTITESPWHKISQDHDNDIGTPDIETYSPHRHFYLSDGAYKFSGEVQFFKKRAKYPVFWGGTFSFRTPLNTSKYGLRPSTNYEISFMALSGPIKKMKLGNFKVSAIGLSLFLVHNTRSKWDDLGETPNSKTIQYTPGFSILLASKAGTFGISLQRGYEKYFNENPSDIDEEMDIYALTISYRKLLDKVIDRLYW